MGLASRKCEIVSMMRSGVAIEDMGIRLPGIGSRIPVLTATAEASQDLKDAVRMHRVKVVPTPDVAPVPLWPFTSSRPDPPRRREAAPIPEVIPEPQKADEMVELLRSIDGKLGDLLSRPPLPPDVPAYISNLAASAIASTPSSPTKPKASHPQFVPSTVMPKDVEADIRSKTDEIEKGDLDDGTAALRKLRVPKK